MVDGLLFLGQRGRESSLGVDGVFSLLSVSGLGFSFHSSQNGGMWVQLFKGFSVDEWVGLEGVVVS